jgi:uncharacterized protein DUF4333
MRGRIAIGLVAGVSGCLSLLPVACGGDSNLDTGALESQMKDTLGDRTGIPIQSVTCPDDVKPEKGSSFRCTATTERGERVLLNVTQEDGEGAVEWRVVRGPRQGR